MKYASIDGEMTGLDFERCEIIEIAIVVENTNPVEVGGLPRFPDVDALPYFRATCWPEHRACWEPEAYEMHQKNGLVDELKANPGMSRARFWDTARSFLIAHFGHGKITVAGKNFNGFDRRFMPKEIESMFHHRVLDPGPMFVDWNAECLPSLADLMQRFKLDQGVIHHRALDDARDVVRVLRQSYMK